MVLALAARKLGSSERRATHFCEGSSELVFWLASLPALKLKVPTPTQRKRHIPQLHSYSAQRRFGLYMFSVYK